MEKIEYEPIYFRLCMIYDKRTDVTDPQKKTETQKLRIIRQNVRKNNDNEVSPSGKV